MYQAKNLTMLSFQSTLSVRRATHVGGTECDVVLISIPALREESDFLDTIRGLSNTYFNPRSP